MEIVFQLGSSRAQNAHTLRQQISISRVRFRRRPEPGILPHRPEPAAIHGRLDATGIRKLPGRSDFAHKESDHFTSLVSGCGWTTVAMVMVRFEIAARAAWHAR